MKVLENISLQQYHTFGFEVFAKELVCVESIEDVINILRQMKPKKFIFLGEGSNILFIEDYDGMVIINKIKGKSIDKISESEILVSSFSGENWHEFVLWTIQQNAFGLENLSLIPGSIGAAPMQNIGAYGKEVKNYITKVEAINLQTFEIECFTNDECDFGYRESIFKRKLKDKYFILKVHFKLETIYSWKANCEYGDIKKILEENTIQHPSAIAISNAVIETRTRKLPNPKEIGNAGSFFKNPVVERNVLEKILQKHPAVPYYYINEKSVKIPAAWLIETLDFKGKTFGNVGVHKNQALVLVNYGNGKGNEIFNLSEQIIQAVKNEFSIELEREVNIV